MKNIKYLFLVLSLIFVFEIVNSNQAKACTVNSGVVAKASGDGADFVDDGCDEAPALYEVVIINYIYVQVLQQKLPRHLQLF